MANTQEVCVGWQPYMLLGGSALLDVEHLAATINAAIGAHMVRQLSRAAIRANGDLGNLNLVVRAAVALARVRDSFLWQCAHVKYLLQ